MMERFLLLLTIIGLVLLNASCVINIYPAQEKKPNVVASTYSSVQMKSFVLEASKDDLSQQDMDETIKKLKYRLADHTASGLVTQEGTNRIVVEMPQSIASEQVITRITQIGKLIFCTDLSRQAETVVLDGDNVTNAQAGYDNEQKEYIVQLSLDEDGQKKFALATKELAGTKKPIYIIYDGQIISSPTYEEEINSPTYPVSGSMTYETASDLASCIRTGVIPVILRIVEEN